MALVYSTRFGKGISTAAGAFPFYTVPVGMVAVVRDVRLIQQAGALSVALVDLTTGENLAFAAPSATNEFFAFSLRAVVEAGEVMQYANNGGTWSWYVSGYLLTLP